MPYGFAEAGFMPETWERDDEYAIAKLLYLGNSNSLERDLLATILYRNLPDTWNAFDLAQPMFPVAIMPDDEIPAALAPDSRPSYLDRAPKPVPMDPWSPDAIVDAIGELRHAFGHVGPIGSNNWAIDGRHTETGRPLIANDPHQPLESPSMMYGLHLNSVERGDGTLDVAGFSFAGTMGVQLGHNHRLHWAATTNFADVMDLWEVRVEDQGVWAGDEYVEWETRTEVIEVEGAEDDHARDPRRAWLRRDLAARSAAAARRSARPRAARQLDRLRGHGRRALLLSHVAGDQPRRLGDGRRLHGGRRLQLRGRVRRGHLLSRQHPGARSRSQHRRAALSGDRR